MCSRCSSGQRELRRCLEARRNSRDLHCDAEILRVGVGNAVLKPFLGPGSLLVLEGERHLRERRLVMPAFHNKAIATYGDIIRDALLAATGEWREGTNSWRRM